MRNAVSVTGQGDRKARKRNNIKMYGGFQTGAAFFVEKVMDIKELSRADIHSLIDEWVHNERNREILKRKLTDGITFERLAEEYKLTPRQVQRIVYKEKNTLVKHLG